MWILTIFLINFVLASDAEKCTGLDGPKAYRCIQHLDEIHELSYSIDIYDKENNSKINKPCSEFKKCHEQLKCGVEDGVVKIIEKMTSFCDIVEFHQS
ncbi:hypothetical protein B9Z55_016834 [Caenorhabditis nigoni]|uniref:T20D4.11-like domain-containing protein n=1 Tax=Caenorhabditis nigoni TaxID=1611254 RepID=A0A2G5T721_9PELO|nr:hypothetical protein B9Z55_016834 [Caenorhabditis nigoni]